MGQNIGEMSGQVRSRNLEQVPGDLADDQILGMHIELCAQVT